MFYGVGLCFDGGVGGGCFGNWVVIWFLIFVVGFVGVIGLVGVRVCKFVFLVLFWMLILINGLFILVILFVL